MKKVIALLTLLLGIFLTSHVSVAKEFPIRDPYPIDGAWWVCHEVNGEWNPIEVNTPWKLKVHLAHGDWFTTKNGNCKE